MQNNPGNVRNPTNSQPPATNPPVNNQPQPGPAVATGSDVPAPAAAPALRPIPPGLDLLVPLHYLFVRQQVELLEIYSRIETPNRYDVFTGNGQMIYFAQETLGFIGMIRGESRAFRIDIVDRTGRPVMILNRFDNPYRGEMIVTLPDGSVLGTIVQSSYMTPYFEVRDGFGVLLMIITGPPGGNWRTGQAYFTISMTNGYNLGLIRKTFAGFIQEAISDADNFGVEFPADLDVQWKALMFAAVFLIDFLFFERSPHRRPFS